MTVFEKLQQAVSATMKVAPESVSATSSSENLAKWDSLAHVNLMMTLEQTFDIMLEVEDFPRLTSVQAILDHLQELGVQD